MTGPSAEGGVLASSSIESGAGVRRIALTTSSIAVVALRCSSAARASATAHARAREA